MKRTGEVLGGYIVSGWLGSGGMGTVYDVIDADGRHVALKLLHPHLGADPVARARLRREVETLQRVRHPGVARVLDSETDSDEAFVVTELIDGVTLDTRVRERGPLSLHEVAELGRGLLAALVATHRAGVVHRDIKPANVMLTAHGPVLIDFGISQVVDADRYTQIGLVTGTAGYLDPRVVAGEAPDRPSDWWSWAAVLAFAATGRPPFGTGAPAAVLARTSAGEADLAGLPPDVTRALRAALRPSGRRLPPEDLLAVLDGGPIGAAALAAFEAEGEPPSAWRGRPPGPPSPTRVLPPEPPSPTRVAASTPPPSYPPSPAPYAPPPPPYAPPPPPYAPPAPPYAAAAPPYATSAAYGPSPPPPPRQSAAPFQPPPHQARMPPPADPYRPPAGAPTGYGQPLPPPMPVGVPVPTARPRPVVLFAVWMLLAALAASWPGAVLVVVVVAMLLTGSLGSGVRSHRRRLWQGKGRNVAVVWLLTPWHLLRAVLVVAAGAVVGALAGAAVWWGLPFALTGDVAGRSALDPTMAGAVAAGAVAAAAGAAWLAPTSSLPREGARQALAALVPGRTGTAVVVTLCLLLALVAGTTATLGMTTPDWWPLPEPPV